jgi:hypothetical protein
MSTILTKVLGIGTAALGFVMFNDSRKHYSMEAAHQENEMVEEDHLEHLRHQMGDYSDRSTLNGWKHTIFNSANLHFITRPWIHAKNFANTLMDNAIPIGLGAAGIGFAFPNQVRSTLGAIGTHAPTVFGGIGTALGHVGRALGTVLSGSFGWLRTNFRPNLGGPGGVLVAAALGAMGIYYAAQFKKEITNESRDNLINYLHPPGH